MANNEDQFNTKRNTLSSLSIKENFKKPLKSRGVNIFKIIMLAGLFLVSVLLIYILTKDEKTPFEDSSISKVNVLNVEDTVADVNKILDDTIPTSSVIKTVAPLIVKNVKVNVVASDLVSLRVKLLAASQRALVSGNYTPINLKVNFSKFTASFELEKKPSNFIKLSLLYGPINIGCESCSSSLKRNPGSLSIYSGSDNLFEYGIIAIAK